MSTLTTWLYDSIGSKPSVEEHDTLLNLGYHTDPTQDVTPLEAKQNLYRSVVNGIDLRDQRVLEIGCGRGGGAKMLHQTLQPTHYVATDLSQKSIEFCQQHHQAEGLEFVQADAQKLPFADDSFDVVINVESSHCYKNMKSFIREVHRVLRRGGAFCFCDVLNVKREKSFRSKVEWIFYVKTWEDISAYTVTAIEKTAPATRKSIKNVTPGFKRLLRPLYYNWAALPGSKMFEALSEKKLVYFLAQSKAK